ncbi:MAG: kelch repeat-containing protein [Planctomycetota bacterium]
MPADHPGGRTRHGMTYDQARGRVVLLGGAFGKEAELWEWDGTTWTQAFARPPLPERRVDAAMAADPLRGRVVVHGGRSVTSTFYDDTVEWDGTAWAFASPSGGPQVREHAMAWDPINEAVLLHGGLSASGAANGETLLWDGASWSRADRDMPPRAGHAIVCDTARQRVVMFGGHGRDPANPFDDTWEWDGSRWQPLTPTRRPPGRSGHVMAYDSARDRVVLHGGAQGAIPLGDTWEWDGTDWSLRSALYGAPSAAHGMAFDPASGYTILFAASTQEEVWWWDGSAWAGPGFMAAPTAYREPGGVVYDANRGGVTVIDAFGRVRRFSGASTSSRGVACASTSGIRPTLAPYDLPFAGNRRFALDLTADPSRPAMFFFGIGPWGSPLPGGCTLLVHPASVVATVLGATNSYGHLTLPIGVPRRAPSLGALPSIQAFVLDADSAHGFAASNALSVTIAP